MFLFPRERTRHLKDFSSQLLARTSLQHREILTHMGLEDFCVEPHFSNLRNNMTELVEVLAAVAAGLPQQHYGFYRSETSTVLHMFAIHCCYLLLLLMLLFLLQRTAFSP